MRRSLAALVAPIVLTASTAGAKPAFTPPADAGVGMTAFCVLQNVGSKLRSVSVTLRDADGAVLLDGSFPSQPGAISKPVGGLAPGPVYCEFDGLNRSVRGFIELKQGTTTLAVLPTIK